MSLLPAHNYEAVFGTPDGNTHHLPLVCWHENGHHITGIVLHKGHLRHADTLPGFMRYHTHTNHH